VLAAQDVEVKNNRIENNDGVAVIIVSYGTSSICSRFSMAAALPRRTRARAAGRGAVYIHDNT